MAQKREKEETELKAPETLTLCSPPIAVASSTVSASDDRRPSPERSDLNSAVVSGVIGNFRSNSGSSPETPDLHRTRRSEAVEMVETVEKSMSTGCKSGVIVEVRSNSGPSSEKLDLTRKRGSEAMSIGSKRREVNRCSGCKRKVGLMGFRCRCGDIFCSEHRYSDRHDCSYDYKAAGREAIARENPVVRAAKILKV